MPYIGNNLATQFQAFATQTITGDGSTGYTLDRAVANGKELLVYINNVKQEEGSGKSYTASGTTITFSEAVASTDSCYVVFLGSAIQTVTAPAGSIVSSQFSSADLVLPKTVTIGSAGAEDTKLVFDGNAQDYHVGLDDSEDKLTIGKGTALGTTAHMTFDADGQILKPLQPCFLVNAGSNTNNISNDNTVTFSAEVFDVGANFASNTFTAPVTGKYFISCSLRVDNFDSAANYMVLEIKMSNRSFTEIIDRRQTNGDTEYNSFHISGLADMDANDTAYIIASQSGGTAQADVVNDLSMTFFSGYLVA